MTDISSPDIQNSEKEYEKLIVDYNVSGLMLFNELKLKSFPIEIENQLINEEQAKGLIEKLKSYNSDLFIAVDVEGGSVDRLHNIRGVRYNSAKKIGNLIDGDKDTDWVSDLFYLRGNYLKNLGFNMNAAPVLDTVPSYKDKYLMSCSERSFGSDSKLVSKAGLACIKGFQEAGIIPIAKHFPGLGSVKKDFDPHVDFSKVKKITKKSLKPFFDAVDAGVDVIMTTHLKVENNDNKIATVNKSVVDILRDYGFNGVIMTDDLCFMSTGMLNRNRKLGPTKENIQSIVNTAYNAIKAGHDMILVRQLGCVNDPDTDFINLMLDKIEEGIRYKDISLGQFVDSYMRVFDLKEKWNLKKS